MNAELAFSNLLTLGLLVVALLALGVALYSAWSASRSAAAAEQSAQTAQGVLDHQREELREYWIVLLATTIKSNLKGKSTIPAAREPVAQLLEGLPAPLRDEEKRIVELAHNRVAPARDFDGFWQELEDVRGRGGLADR